jgi:hypothetical protein
MKDYAILFLLVGGVAVVFVVLSFGSGADGAGFTSLSVALSSLFVAIFYFALTRIESTLIEIRDASNQRG